MQLDNPFINFTLHIQEQEIEIGHNKEFQLEMFDGIDIPNVEISSSARGIGHGDVYIGSRLPSRTISLQASNFDVENKQYLIRKLQRCLLPGEKARLVVNHRGSQKEIECYISSFDIQETNIHEPLDFLLILYCPYPLFHDPKGNELTFSTIVPLLSAPLAIPQESKLLFGVENATDTLVIYNQGDWEAGGILNFSLSGDVLGLYITNLSTNKQFLLQETYLFKKGDMITIDTRAGQKDVTLNGLSIKHLIADKCEFFSFQKGKNIVQYNARQGKEFIKMTGTVYNEYLGAR